MKVVSLIMLAMLLVSCVQQGEYDELAKCITSKGAKMYGAYWCSHCKNQKTLFDDSFKYVNYIECATGPGQEVCRNAGINGYPTWEFADGSRMAGEASIEQLKQKTGC